MLLFERGVLLQAVTEGHGVTTALPTLVSGFQSYPDSWKWEIVQGSTCWRFYGTREERHVVSHSHAVN